MVKCPDEGCKEQMEELKLEVKGRPGTGTGIRTCMNKMVPKSWVWKWAMVGLSLSLGFGGAWMSLNADVQAGKHDHAQNVQDIATIKQDIQDITKKVDANGGDLREIKTILRESVMKALDDLKKRNP